MIRKGTTLLVSYSSPQTGVERNKLEISLRQWYKIIVIGTIWKRRRYYQSVNYSHEILDFSNDVEIGEFRLSDVRPYLWTSVKQVRNTSVLLWEGMILERRTKIIYREIRHTQIHFFYFLIKLFPLVISEWKNKRKQTHYSEFATVQNN